MKLNDSSINKMSGNELGAKNDKLLMIVLVAMVILFVLFCGGALSVTIQLGDIMGSGWTMGISWMWMPALLFLTLSILLGWVIFAKKKG